MEYYDVVDYLVIVEAKQSHTGKDKELVFEQNKDKFSKYMDKVIHVIVDKLPDYSVEDIWKAENYQRNCIMSGLKNIAEPGDKIIVSDCDEFWDVDVFEANKHRVEPFSFIQQLFYYWVNCLQAQTWPGSCCATYGTFRFPQELRNWGRGGVNGADPGGWHYSFMGGADRIKTKVENIAESHMIIDEVGDIDQIQKRMDNVEDLWGREDDFAQKTLIDLDYKPKSLEKFIELYPDFYREPKHE
jgi:beta-1,4-mannosyl-glycoprotein beta-1,4-N-acetylglucosaminyltransferase